MSMITSNQQPFVGRLEAMVSQFQIVGEIVQVHPRVLTATGESVALTLSASNEDRVHVSLTGKILDVVAQLQPGDLVYVHGRFRTDKNLSANIPKNVIVLYANHLAIVRPASTGS